MRGFGNAALGLLGAAAVAAASDVHELKQDTFPGFISDHNLVLAECKDVHSQLEAHSRADETVQSLRHGAAIAKLSRQSMRRLLPR